jgi:hypothetical protein
LPVGAPLTHAGNGHTSLFPPFLRCDSDCSGAADGPRLPPRELPLSTATRPPAVPTASIPMCLTRHACQAVCMPVFDTPRVPGAGGTGVQFGPQAHVHTGALPRWARAPLLQGRGHHDHGEGHTGEWLVRGCVGLCMWVSVWKARSRELSVLVAEHARRVTASPSQARPPPLAAATPRLPPPADAAANQQRAGAPGGS